MSLYMNIYSWEALFFHIYSMLSTSTEMPTTILITSIISISDIYIYIYIYI